MSPYPSLWDKVEKCFNRSGKIFEKTHILGHIFLNDLGFTLLGSRWYNSLTFMEKPPLVRLDLRAPLEYADAPGLDPFAAAPTEGAAPQELAFCFELDREQAGRIDPEAGCFLGELVFSGREQSGGERVIPAGLYLFVQQRRVLNRDECIGLAIEQQKDGLWERHRLENRLFIRRLFEDGSPVTQIFRPCSRTH